MANTNFKIFNEEMSADRTFSDSEYAVATQRQTGVIPGMALSRLHNKLYHQSSAMAKAVADFLVSHGIDCMDNDVPAITAGIDNAILNIINEQTDEFLPLSGGTMTGPITLASDPTTNMQAATKQYADNNGGVNLRKNSHAYAVGDICYSKTAASYKYMECTVAGTTAASEPTWPEVGQPITDGTVTWVVRDIKDARKLQTARSINGVAFDGTADISIPQSGIQGSFKSLKILTSDTKAVITADQIVLLNNLNSTYLATNVNLTADITVSGANGLDTGTKINSTWYSVWVIAKADGTKASLLSINATAPTMPAEYTYKARLGWARVGSDGNFLRTLQYGRKTQYVVTPSTNTANLPIMVTGTYGSVSNPTYVSVAVSGVVPPTASLIFVVLGGVLAGNTQAIVAPNINYGGYNSSTNDPPMAISAPTGANLVTNIMASLMLESTNLYYASSASSATLICKGWEDNL